jgi:transcriptional regulator with XRE-family HTH domain
MTRPRTRPTPQPALPQFRVNVRAARVAAGLTQEQLAHATGVVLRTVAGWESGETEQPEGQNLRALAKALDKDPAWFYAVHEHNGDPVAA